MKEVEREDEKRGGKKGEGEWIGCYERMCYERVC